MLPDTTTLLTFNQEGIAVEVKLSSLLATQVSEICVVGPITHVGLILQWEQT